jgi:glycosyltransferase involved in cell wall biosynthesis
VKNGGALPYAPWAVTKGRDRLIVTLLEGLSVRHEVVLVTMALDREQLARLSEIETPRVAVRAMLAPNRRSPLHRAAYKARNAGAMLLARIPMQVSYAAPPGLLRLVAETARAERAELVLASYWHLYRVPEFLPGARLALVTMDLDFLVHPERIAKARGGAARAREAARTRLLERIELEAYSRFDTILTVTEADAAAMRAHPVTSAKAIHTLPLALDLGRFDPAGFVRERDRVLLLGAFHADFNGDALRYFLRDVWPLVRERNPAARLDVVGHGVEPGLRALAGPGVSFAGGVEDIRPVLGRCAVMALPLRFGGGVRIRMMEAAAMAAPVVSTPVGVAGMGLEAGREYLEAEDPRGMADAIARLLGDPDEAARLGLGARAWAERNISMKTYPDRLDALLEAIVLPPPLP